MDREIDIIELIKSRRYFKMAIKHLLPSSKMRMKLKERSRYIKIDPDPKLEAPFRDQKFKEVIGSAMNKTKQNDSEVELTDGFYSSEEEDNEVGSKIEDVSESSSANGNDDAE